VTFLDMEFLPIEILRGFDFPASIGLTLAFASALPIWRRGTQPNLSRAREYQIALRLRQVPLRSKQSWD
jgi:hypothetical protein